MEAGEVKFNIFYLTQYIQSITLIDIINQYKIIGGIFYLLVLSL